MVRLQCHVCRKDPRHRRIGAEILDEDELLSKLLAALGRSPFGDDHLGACVIGHVAQALLGIGGIERDIGSASLEHAEERHNQIERARRADADP